jgi:putative component of toxin-antitoxin plasmid stabilization module
MMAIEKLKLFLHNNTADHKISRRLNENTDGMPGEYMPVAHG